MPTTIRHIGTGRDHTNVASWLSATAYDLVSATMIEQGHWHDDATWTDATSHATAGATVSENWYRHLMAATGKEYNPVTGTGLQNAYNAATGSTHNKWNVQENYFRIGPGIAFKLTGTSNGVARIVYGFGTGDFLRINRCYFEAKDNATGAYNHTIYMVEFANSCDNTTVRNSIFRGIEGSKDKPNIALLLQNADFVTIHNNVFYDCVGHNVQYANAGASNGDFRNNISTNPGVLCFSFGAATFDQNNYNCSSDSSAVGANSLTNQVATDLFTDPANGNFTLKAGSNAIDAGEDLSGIFSLDYTGQTRNVPWEMGAYLYAVSGPLQIFPVSIPSAESVPSPTLQAGGSAPIGPVSISSAESVPAPTIQGSGTRNLGPTSIASAESVPAPTIQASGSSALSPASIPSAESVPEPTVQGQGSTSVGPVSIGSAESVPAPTLGASGSASITPASIPSAESVPDPTLQGQGTATLGPVSIGSAESVPDPTVTTAGAIYPVSIPSEESVPQPVLQGQGTATLGPVSIGSQESVAAPSLSGSGSASLEAASIPSEESVPPGALQGTGTAILGPASIASEESFGVPTIATAGVLYPVSIPSEESVPDPTASGAGLVSLEAVSITSEEAVAEATLQAQGTATLVPTSIGSGESFEIPWVIGDLTLIYPVSIPSAESFGGLRVRPPTTPRAEGTIVALSRSRSQATSMAKSRGDATLES